MKKSSALKKEASLYFIDYGNEETLPFSRIRPLDAKFKSLPGQAKQARLRFDISIDSQFRLTALKVSSKSFKRPASMGLRHGGDLVRSPR